MNRPLRKSAQTTRQILIPTGGFADGQVILTKKQYQKTGGYIAWHGYQSFKPDEVTPEQCHEIGLKLAGEMWGDKYQIIVAPHLDKRNPHHHMKKRLSENTDNKEGNKINSCNDCNNQIFHYTRQPEKAIFYCHRG
ncbi:relaxase/mobilization nuclease domain-containing protein [Candidatus Ventrimonas sp. KK005]